MNSKDKDMSEQSNAAKLADLRGIIEELRAAGMSDPYDERDISADWLQGKIVAALEKIGGAPLLSHIAELEARVASQLSALDYALTALKHSEPMMKHYLEPVERHQNALQMVTAAIDSAIRGNE